MRKERSDKGKKHNMGEAGMQERIVADLIARKITHYGTPNGVADMLCAIGVAKAMKKRGAHSGVPDILIFKCGALQEPGLAVAS